MTKGYTIVQNWAVADGHLVSTIQDNQDYFRFKYSSDSTELYSISVRQAVHRWNVATGQMDQTYNTLASAILLSPDTSTLATLKFGTVNIWDTATQNVKQSFYTLGNALRFSPNGQLLLTPDTISFNNHQSVISLWDVASGTKKAEVPGNNGWFLTNQDWLAVDSNAKTLTIYDINGHTLSAISWPCQQALTYSGDYQWFGCGTSLLDATTFHLLDNPWNYPSIGQSYFTSDNSDWLVAQKDRVLVFGIPSAAHSAWQPIKAKITVSELTVHRAPNGTSAAAGFVNGAVTITGTDSTGKWLYIAEKQGWVKPDFVSLNGYPIAQLPMLNNGNLDGGHVFQ